MSVKDNVAQHRFELEEKGFIAYASYRRAGSQMFIPHVEAAAEMRGTGAASRLMAGIVELARAEGVKIKPTCSYAIGWFRQHREAADILA